MFLASAKLVVVDGLTTGTLSSDNGQTISWYRRRRFLRWLGPDASLDKLPKLLLHSLVLLVFL